MNKLEIIEKISRILQDHDDVDLSGFELVLYKEGREIVYDELFEDENESEEDLEEDPLEEIKF